MELGKLAAHRNLKVVQFTDLTRSISLPPPPVLTDWLTKVRVWPLGENDRIGDCTIVGGVDHMLVGWETYAECKNPFGLTDQQIVDIYSTVTGYDPTDPSTDNGANINDVLNYWMRTGMPGGNKLAGRCAINPASLDEIRTGLDWFVGLSVGAQMPLNAQDQVGQGKIWEVQDLHGQGTPGSWGGHNFRIGYHDAKQKMFACSTWGQVQQMTEEWLLTYCDEVHGLIDDVMLREDKLSPSNLDLPALLKNAGIIQH